LAGKFCAHGKSSHRGVGADSLPDPPRPICKTPPPSRLGRPARARVPPRAPGPDKRSPENKGGREGRAIERHLQPVRQDVQRKTNAHAMISKGKQMKMIVGYFQQPKRQQRQGVGQEELQHAVKQEPTTGSTPSSASPAARQNSGGSTWKCPRALWNRGENQLPEKKKAYPIGQVINRLEQELADVAVLDVGGDLPVVLR